MADDRKVRVLSESVRQRTGSQACLFGIAAVDGRFAKFRAAVRVVVANGKCVAGEGLAR